MRLWVVLATVEGVFLVVGRFMSFLETCWRCRNGRLVSDRFATMIKVSAKLLFDWGGGGCPPLSHSAHPSSNLFSISASSPVDVSV